jgi:hypothetical protein
MKSWKSTARWLASATALALVMGCASTTITVQPEKQASLCDATATALVVWAPKWRPDQKDVPLREAAAESGLKDFFARSGCFARADVHRIPEVSSDATRAQLASTQLPYQRIIGVEVRELGPVIKLLASLALVDGGTEVVLRVVEYHAQSSNELRQFTVHWQHGGPGVIKGVASLPDDMQAALRAGLLGIQ